MAREDRPGRSVPAFIPVPRRPRHDGWTADRQIAFIQALAETACVEDSCRRVGMSPSSAYALRRAPDAELFRRAWDAALDHAMNLVESNAVSRSIHGVPRPIFYRGEQVGEWREFDERLTMFLLRYRRPARFGGWIDGCQPEPPGVEPVPGANLDPDDDSAGRLGYYCDGIAELECRSEAPESGGEGSPPRAKGA